mgnify:CR=1 FL=1
MYSSFSFRRELLFVVGLLLLLWGVCVLAGITRWLLAGAFAAYLFWHLYLLWCLARWLHDSSARLPADTPGIWGYVYYRLEVKRRKSSKRKKQVGRLLKQFKSSTRALPDATIVLNKEFRIQWLNSAATTILSVRKSDVGQPITNLLRHPELQRYIDKERFDKSIVLRSQTDNDGRITLKIIPYERGQFLLLARDITEQYRVESMRRDFVSNASHELRTPLSVLQGSIEQMEQVAGDDSALVNPLARMRRQSERMMSILKDLLTLARLESSGEPAKTQEVNLSQLVTIIVEEARVAGNKHDAHDFQCEIENDIHVYGEQDDLYGALSNLVMNAVRYTPAGGEIRVVLFRMPLGVRFEVTDTGVGILPQHLPRLTERFYRVDVGRSREVGGTGLGLSIVKHTLEQYRSSLEVSSEPGVGSSFGFTLPQEFLCGEPVQDKQAGAASA